MKKTLLAVSVLSTLFMAGAANAAFVESTDGTFAGKIDFNGTITDTTPVWMWEIPTDSTTAATDWNVEFVNGQVNGENTSFTFASKPAIELIKGYMKIPVASGGVGITPEIKVGTVGSETILDGTKQSISVVATGLSSSDVATPAGAMTLNAQGFLGGAYGVIGSATLPIYFGDVAAQAILATNQTDFDTTYPGITATTGSFADAVADFANQSKMQLSGAYKVDISDYALTFPTATLPAKWTAIVPVTVILK